MPPRDALKALLGDWEGQIHTWFEPDSAPVSALITSRMTKAADGLAVIQQYESTMDGEPFSGVALYAFDAPTSTFTMTWVDSFHMSTGPMFSRGPVDPDALLNVVGSYSAGEETWGWRTEIRLIDPDRLLGFAFNITPDGVEHKALETHLHRKA